MSTRAAARLAWSMCALSLALTATSLLLLALNLSHDVHIFDYWAEYTVTAVCGSTVGAVLASRCPSIPIGWIFCTGGGLSAGIEHFGAQYATFALLAEPGSLPGGEAAAWLTSWIWTFSVGLFVFLCLLFPYGRLPNGRWRWVARPSGIVLLAGAVLIAFQPGPIDGLGPIRNPLGLERANLVPGMGNDFLVQALLGALGLVAIASLFARLRHATEVEERQQIKVFTYAATLLASGVVLAYTIYEIVSIPWILWIGCVLVMAGLIGVPVAVGIAVMRYHLYHIDEIIKQTIVYGLLTSILAALFELNVVLLSRFFSGFVAHHHLTGFHQLAEVLAALTIAVLFEPLRGRIQEVVNRHFPPREEESRTPAR